MKYIKRLLLTHWHYFDNEIIEFDKINFLTGKNASGKSTVIDAMQLVLLSDTSGTYFNKAASGRGSRTLMGYLRGELGDDERSGFNYLRDGRFTSYIALEFHDDTKKEYFTCGCCFDIFGENDEQRLFFRYNGRIPENRFLDSGTPLPIDKLRIFIRTNFKDSQAYTTNVNKDFREDICGKLGGLQPKRFTELLRKAVSFNPNVDIQQFITDFVCGEEQKVDVSGMRENIRSYDTLREESKNLKERVDLLSQITASFNDYVKFSENETLYSYLIERAHQENTELELEKSKREATLLQDNLNAIEDKLGKAEAEHVQLQKERDDLKLQLDSNENSRRLLELQKQIDEKNERCRIIKLNYERYSNLLKNAISSWKSCISNVKRNIAETDLSIMDITLSERIKSLVGEGMAFLERTEEFSDTDESIVKIGCENLYVIFNEADSYRDRCKSLSDRIDIEQTEAIRIQAELKKERDSLEKGVYQFPKDAVDLKEAIESRLRSHFGSNAKAAIFAEAAEVRSDRWRNVIEGYLNTRKFYIIVAPEHFSSAFKIYDSIKKQKTIYTTGLVDTEKLLKLAPMRDNTSLAEELDTPDPAVRLYIDYTLGRIRKCDSIHELRRYKTSVTEDGVLYQNFVVRAIDPNHWSKPAIGQSGARLRLEAVRMELLRLSQELSVYAALISVLKGIDGFIRGSASDAEIIVSAAREYQNLPILEETIERLKTDMEVIDKSEIELIKARLFERETAIGKVIECIRMSEVEKGRVKAILRIYSEEKIPLLEASARRGKDDLEVKYDSDWVTNVGGVRYERELFYRKSAEEIYTAFPRERARSQNSKNEAWDKTRNLRDKYNQSYLMGYDINAQENDVYRKAYLDYSENRLPEYAAKIEDARQKAFQQFQEDFLSRLQHNIFSARRHIDELNTAIKGANFGEDTYRFRVIAKPEFKRYHDMIIDEMLLAGGYNLFSEIYNAKYKDEITELFVLITNDNSTLYAQSFEDYERRVQKFTDYKTYLDFDLEVMKPNGETERLSKTIGKKSGGETQTPFYIAVLASFVQLYRVGREITPNTIRIILFDEAFSKMDSERIIQSIELLRRFNFQVVLSAPPDKVSDIARLVDRNLLVHREGHKTRVFSFDPKKMEDWADE